MKQFIAIVTVGSLSLLLGSSELDGRGFGGGGRGGGGFGGGGFGGGGGRSGGFGGGFGGGERGGGGDRGGSSSGGGGNRGGSSFGGGGDRGGSSFGGGGDRGGSSFGGGGDRGGSGFGGGDRGGNPSGKGESGFGNKGSGGNPYGSYAGAGQRPSGGGYGTHGSTPVGPYGRPVGGGAAGATTRPAGASNWQSAFGSAHSATDMGLAHYSSLSATHVNAASVHSTTYHSASYTHAQATAVRGNFGYYNCFHPNWNAAHPGAWYAAGWAGATAWHATAWPAVAAWCTVPTAGVVSAPVDYDYGNSVVYQDNSVYINGQDAGTVQNFNQQAVNLADQGQKAAAPPEDEWKAIGVFALAQGDEKTSNNIFQIAVNKDGTLRGNYYDGLMDTTTPIYGSVDKKSQRAAWTIGKSKNRVFEAGIYNLTKSQTPVLVHIGTDRTQQMLLVRVEQPSNP